MFPLNLNRPSSREWLLRLTREILSPDLVYGRVDVVGIDSHCEEGKVYVAPSGGREDLARVGRELKEGHPGV